MVVEGVRAAPGDVVLCSSNASEVQSNADCYSSSITPDGRYAVFASPSTNLLTGLTGIQQIFRKDLQTGDVKLVSCNSSAVQGNNGSFQPSITPDGRYVSFSSAATNLITGGTSNSQVFRKDLQTGEVLLCSANGSGNQGNAISQRPSISDSGRYVVFESSATNLVTPATTSQQVFRKDLQTAEVKICSASSSGIQGNDKSALPRITSDGRYVAFESDATNLVPGGTSGKQVFRKDLQTEEAITCSSSSMGVMGNSDSGTPCMSPDGRYVAFDSLATDLVTPATTNQQIFRKDLQTGKVMLCSADPSGYQGEGYSYGAALSPDGRYAAFVSQAENLVPGVSGWQIFRKDLQTWKVMLVTSNASGVQANDNSLNPSIVSDGRYVAFGSDATNLVAGGTAGRQIFRKELVVPYEFYFAEGYTGSGFQEYLCLGNPSDTGTFATITYMFPDGSIQEQEVELGADSRTTVNVNGFVGADREVSAKVGCDMHIVAERPMYFDYQGKWTGGHDVVGVSSPSDTWYFAEGYTGSGFDEWVCVLNPGDAAADLTFRFQTQEEGEKTVTGFGVPAHSRASFKANDLLGGMSYQTSLALESSQPVVAERPMYFSYSGTGGWAWTGGHCVMGVPDLSTGYYFAEGTTRLGAQEGFEEWLTMQNPGPDEITIEAFYMLGTGETVKKEYLVPAAKRSTVRVAQEVPLDQDVSVFLSSASPFLAERPMYFNYQGMGAWGWTGGHCVIGADESAQDWFFAEGYTGTGFEEWLCIQNPGAADAAITVTYYPEGGAAPIVREHQIAANSRFTIPVNVDAGADLAISADVTSNQPIICERPMYFNYGGAWTGGHDVVGYTP
jgi:Tol biopolymer transport system component